MCIANENGLHLFSIDEMVDCSCVTSAAGKIKVVPITGYEDRDGGEKMVFLGHNEEAVAKIVRLSDGTWRSLDMPVTLNLPQGKRLVCTSQIAYVPPSL